MENKVNDRTHWIPNWPSSEAPNLFSSLKTSSTKELSSFLRLALWLGLFFIFIYVYIYYLCFIALLKHNWYSTCCTYFRWEIILTIKTMSISVFPQVSLCPFHMPPHPPLLPSCADPQIAANLLPVTLHQLVGPVFIEMQSHSMYLFSGSLLSLSIILLRFISSVVCISDFHIWIGFYFIGMRYICVLICWWTFGGGLQVWLSQVKLLRMFLDLNVRAQNINILEENMGRISDFSFGKYFLIISKNQGLWNKTYQRSVLIKNKTLLLLR